MGKKNNRKKPLRVPGHRLMALTATKNVYRNQYNTTCECGVTDGPWRLAESAREGHEFHAIRVLIGEQTDADAVPAESQEV